MNEQKIAERAYERFVERGGEHGHDVEDWLAAEAELQDYDVLLIDPGAREIELMREIRHLTGLNLVAIKSLLASRTRPIKKAVSLREAEALRAQLESFGARVELRTAKSRSLSD